jgi:hypothetical protein
LKDGDRVLLLGDGLAMQEDAFGYLETRMTSHYPDRNIKFRNLPWVGTGLLGKAEDGWLEAAVAEVQLVKPTVVLMAYGMAASLADENGLAAFKTNYIRLLDAIKGPSTNSAVRFVLISPITHQPVPGQPAPTNHNERLAQYTLALQELARVRSLGFVDVFGWTGRDASLANTLREKSSLKIPALSQRGTNLTAYGFMRLTFRLENALRWKSNNWRFGLMADGTLRDGGLGNTMVEYKRSDVHARVVTLDDRLPTPVVEGYVDLEPNTKPQCYIQLPGLQPGQYTLKVDGKPVLTASETEWARYRIVAQGPQWDQAEQLRQTILKKNALFRQWRQQHKELAGAAVDPASQKAKGLADLEKQITEQETQIARLRKPIVRTLEVIQEPLRSLAAPTTPGAPPPLPPTPPNPLPKPAND